MRTAGGAQELIAVTRGASWAQLQATPGLYKENIGLFLKSA